MYFHLLPKADEQKILTFMEQKGFSCGVMLSYFVLRVFAERGQYDTVYELLVNEGTRMGQHAARGCNDLF